MEKKKIKLGLFPKVVIAITVGALLGLVGKLIPEPTNITILKDSADSTAVVKVTNTLVSTTQVVTKSKKPLKSPKVSAHIAAKIKDN